MSAHAMSAPMSVLVRRAYETSRGWLALGHERVPSPHAWIVRAADVPAVYDANFAAMVRAESEAEIAALQAQLDEVFAGSDHRFVFWDADMPQPFEARLVLDGWQRYNEMVALVLQEDLRERGPRVRIRPVESERWGFARSAYNAAISRILISLDPPNRAVANKTTRVHDLSDPAYRKRSRAYSELQR